LKFDIIPYDCTVTLNSYRQADTASVTIPFRALPIDPRIIRALAIEIFMANLDPGDYAEAMGPIGASNPLPTAPDTVDPFTPSPSNQVFAGFVDSVEVNQDGDDTITLECRDQTAIFINGEVPQQALSGLPRDLPLDLVISQILIGDAKAQTLVQPPPLKWTVGQRQTLRGQRRQSAAALKAIGAKIATLTATASTTLDPIANAEIVAKIAELTAKQLALTSVLSEQTISEETQDAIPLLAQRFGLPGARGTQVVNETRFAVLPTIGELKGVKYFDSKGTAKKSPTAGARQRINYWDLITDLCVASGFICYIRRNVDGQAGGVTGPPQLVISEPRTYYGDQAEPLRGGEGEVVILADELREFSYGYNVDSIAVERNLTGKNAPIAIQVNARVAETNELVSARFPPTNRDPTGQAPAPANVAAPSGIGDRIEVQTLNYRGEIPQARAEEILQLVAETVYEELSRGEFLISIKTRDLSFFPSNRGAVPGVADIFQLQSGDSIRIGTISTPTPEIEEGLISQGGIFAAQPFADRVFTFIDLGLSPSAATQAAAAYESNAFPDVYRVQAVDLRFDHNNGFDIEIQAINYLDARNALRNVEGSGPV